MIKGFHRLAALVRRLPRLGIMALVISPGFVWGADHAFTVRGLIQTAEAKPARKVLENANVVVWLVPVKEENNSPEVNAASPRRKFVLVQKNKQFSPHVLVIPAGSEVEFPNKDPFFHNVFSLFEGKRFDLGLYESGGSKTLRFDRPGISYLFCNIHPEMSAVIIALQTPYYAVSDQAGAVSIPEVPPGKYMLHVWKEGIPLDKLKTLSRPVSVGDESASLGTLNVPSNINSPLTHKNKYGQDYDDHGTTGLPYGDHQ